MRENGRMENRMEEVSIIYVGRNCSFLVFSGRFNWVSGSVYEGEFKNGWKHGKGMTTGKERKNYMTEFLIFLTK